MTGRKRSNRDGFVRRNARRVRATACFYAMEWSNDPFTMTLSHVLLASTLTLAALSAWGFIP